MMLIMDEDGKSPISEAYRTLRTNIQFTDLDTEDKVLLVTSTLQGEGKSTTIANLALSIAETDKKVLLIDCDMRRPSIHKMFKISNIKGVSNYLINKAKLEDVIYPINESLSVLPSGTTPPNPSELLGSNKMERFLDEMRKQYDYILLDAPPVIAVTDAQVLATLSSGVILVVESGEVPRDLAMRSKELLEKVGANIIGVTLTCADKNSEYDYYNYYTKENRKTNKKQNLLG